MGSICSNIEKDDAPGEKDGHGQRRDNNSLTRQTSKRLQKPQHHHHSASPIADILTRHREDMASAQNMIDAHDKTIRGVEDSLKDRLKDRLRDTDGGGSHAGKTSRVTTLDLTADNRHETRSKTRKAAEAKFHNVDDYMRQRNEIERRESTLAFDFKLTVKASGKERMANRIIQAVKAADKENVYDKAPKRLGWGGQVHEPFPGDHFLSNVELIEKTKLFRIAAKMPKGAHLHIHFNACLLPHVLLGMAKEMERMFITSDLSLAPGGHGISALDRCEIRFSILSDEDEKKKPGDIFSLDYTEGEERKTMKYSQFLSDFRLHYDLDPEEWLASKLIFDEEEAHNHLQTVKGAWAKFNGRTRMMKGLFNYESAYRRYTQLLLEDFVRDNIQYAEIRPNFMVDNQVWHDDGSAQIDNEGIMKIIMEECEKFRQTDAGKRFAGLKVIYCTPRSFDQWKVEAGLKECLKFKKKWPQWIAGFDLVGEESEGKPLRAFIKEFLDFRTNCENEEVEIPFLFHCGETTEMGRGPDGNGPDANLLDALLLNSKRIGHGFSLARHPYIMEHMKKKGVCLELCPISNEELGLTPRVSGHAMYNLLANNVHCTLNSDNGTIFRSTLSHDFYQAMVGKSDMTLHGWRQLIEWSLEHSCMDPDELKTVREEWVKRWDKFVKEIIVEYGDVLDEPQEEDGTNAAKEGST